jgi:hypothetical protein
LVVVVLVVPAAVMVVFPVGAAHWPLILVLLLHKEAVPDKVDQEVDHYLNLVEMVVVDLCLPLQLLELLEPNHQKIQEIRL